MLSVDPSGPTDAAGTERISIPRLLSRSPSMWVSVSAAAVSIPVLVVWALLTQPVTNQVAAVVVGAVLLVFFALLIFRSTSLDTERGLVVRTICGVWDRRVAWAGAGVVRIRNNKAVQALLEVRGEGRRTSGIERRVGDLDRLGDRAGRIAPYWGRRYLKWQLNQSLRAIIR